MNSEFRDAGQLQRCRAFDQTLLFIETDRYTEKLLEERSRCKIMLKSYLFLTGGGSAAMGSYTQGCVWNAYRFAAKSMKSKWQERRANEFAIKFQESSVGEGGALTRATRRIIAFMGIGNLFRLCLALQFSHQSEFLSVQQILQGKEKQRFFSDSSQFSCKQANFTSSGHLAYIQTSVVLPMIVGFYFTSPSR